MANHMTLMPGLAALAVAVGFSPAMAETGAPHAAATKTSFTLEDFAQYNPRTAFDMITRIPGFSVQGDDDGSRGFGQATGNVLINGQRVSGKSNGAEAALSRIGADKVTRIDLVDGTTLDIPGLSGQVVNVITNGDGGTSGTWRWKMRVRENLEPYYHEGNITVSGGKEALTWSAELNSAPERGADAGWDRITDGDGVLIEKRKADFTHLANYGSLAGSVGWKPASGAVGNLNGTVEIYQSNNKEVSRTYPVGGPEGRRFFKGSTDLWNAELGGDYEFSIGPGRLKAIGLVRREHDPAVNRFIQGNIDGTNLNASNFDQTVDTGESILRGEYSFSTEKGRDWQVSVENAFNYLEAESSLQTAANGGPFIDIPLDTSNTRVEEERTEVAITNGRKLSPNLNLQVSLAGEMSKLTQSGDTGKEREFTRPKGFASLSWQADPSLKVTTRLEREVGQLDFFDFISSVNLNNDNSSSGNPEIVPEQAWTLSVQTEKDFKEWGALTLNVFYSDIEDIIDRVPIGTGDGPGNLPEAWKTGATLDGTLKLAKLGLKGAELKSHAEWYDSQVDDPLTGNARPINGSQIYYYNLEFRQDIPGTDWAWGGLVERYELNPYYQLNERSFEGGEPGYGYMFVERKNLWQKMTATVAVGNLLNQEDTFHREIYAPNRLGSVVRVEERSRGFGPIAIFELKGKF